MSAAFLGSSVGLGLGVVYINAGLSQHAADQAEAVRMADLAATSRAGAHLEKQGVGLGKGADLFNFQARVERLVAQKQFVAAVKARKRADLECMTQAIYYEARSETARGQAAVGQVVMNRVKHPAFPKSVCAVVFQGASRPGCQFSFACDGSMRQRRERIAWREAREVAARVLAGRVVGGIGAATHYHTTAVNPYWAPRMLRVTALGEHIFYRFSPYRMRAMQVTDGALQQAVLTSAPARQAPDLAIERAIDASLAPASPDAPKAPPMIAAKPTDEARLTTPQPVATGAS